MIVSLVSNEIYDTNGNYLENRVKDSFLQELSSVGRYRGDPRLFHYPDGTAGALNERTSTFYRLTEIKI